MIRRIRLRRVGLAAMVFASALALAGGCSSPAATSSNEEATVHGTVTVKGKRASTGKVYFNPANINRKNASTATADIAKDGSFTLKTLVGRNTVSVSTPVTVKDPILQYNSSYFNVAGGDNTYEIDVSKRR
jgi:uncharacterized cupredoxin-like copper-binding protein